MICFLSQPFSVSRWRTDETIALSPQMYASKWSLPFSGRVPISVELLRLACEDPKRFVKAKLKEQGDQGPTLFDLADGKEASGGEE